MNNLKFWCLPLLVGLQWQCAQVTHIAGEGAQTYRIEARSKDLPAGSELQEMIAPYKAQLQEEMDQVIGTADQALTKGSPESSLGNWVADAVFEYAERHTGQDLAFGLCNTGGIRIPTIAKGPVTKRKIFELMPFDNYLVITNIPGPVLKQLFDRMADYGGWPVSSGVRFTIEGKEASNITIDGEPLDLSRTYPVVLSDYISEGGGDCFFLADLPYENLNVYYRDAMIKQVEWLTDQGRSLEAKIEGRVKIKE